MPTHKPVAVDFVRGDGYYDTLIVGSGSVTSMEELEESGPMSMIPYIQVNYADGSFTHIPKHNVASVTYAPLGVDDA